VSNYNEITNIIVPAIILGLVVQIIITNVIFSGHGVKCTVHTEL